MIRRDHEKTKEAKFADRRSYIRPDGRYKLYGKDMSLLREMCWERCREACYYCSTKIDKEYAEMHHVVRRSKGGDDSIANVVMLCRKCHHNVHGREVRWSRRT